MTASSTSAQFWRDSAWVGIPASILLADVVVRWQGDLPPYFTTDPSNTVLSLVASALFWWAASRLIGPSPRRWVWALLLAAPYAVILTLSWRYRMVAHKDVNAGILLYAWLEPKNAVQLASAGWSWVVPAIATALTAVWAWLLTRWRQERSRITTAVSIGAMGLWFAGAYALPQAAPLKGTHYVSDFNITNVFGAFLGGLGAPSAHQPVLGRADARTAPEPVELGDAPDVVVFIGETLIKSRMGLYEHARPTTPRMDAFVEARHSEVFHFDRAYTASAFSPVSVASIALGKYGKHSRETLQTAPSIWQYGSAGGARTALVTPQSWAWSGMNLFFLMDGGPNIYATAEELEAPIVNDTGVSDRIAAERFADIVDHEISADERLVAVVQTNATHFPFLSPADLPWEKKSLVDRYDGAVRVVDSFFGLVVDTLERNGRLDNTIIVMTSDHGEFFPDQFDLWRREHATELTPDVMGGRVHSCHPAVAHIPMFIYLPEKWQRRRAGAARALRDNRDQVVSNVDILPTMLDLMGWPEPRGDFDGRSLAAPLPAERRVMCFSEPGWDTWLHNSAAVISREQILYAHEGLDRLVRFSPAPIDPLLPLGGTTATAEDWEELSRQAARYPTVARALRELAERHQAAPFAAQLREAAPPEDD